MTNKELVAKCIDIAKNYKTLYVMGCFGAPLTGGNVTRYCQNHEYNRAADRTRMIKAAANQCSALTACVSSRVSCGAGTATPPAPTAEPGMLPTASLTSALIP